MEKVHTLQGILCTLHFASGLLKLALKLSPHLIQSSSLSLHLQIRQPTVLTSRSLAATTLLQASPAGKTHQSFWPQAVLLQHCFSFNIGHLEQYA